MIDREWLAKNFGQFEILEDLGAGGQKSVFKVRGRDHGISVLKIFHPNSDLERINREFIALQEIQSEFIPKIYSFDNVNSPFGRIFWFCEEYIEGETLADSILIKGVCQPEVVVRYGLCLLEALAAAESKSIVHRDVKPDNVLVNTKGHAHLLDFGIARHLNMPSRTATALPMAACTPGYAPPEQFRNRKDSIDARTDLFSLGVTLYEAITGDNPYIVNGEEDPELIFRRVETESLPNIDVDGSGALKDFCAAMTQIHQAHRPKSVSYALDWLREIAREMKVE